ncbi:MAG: hypothetical protein ACKPKO_18015, partial [Candidatus Fonsibacter sp.]
MTQKATFAHVFAVYTNDRLVFRLFLQLLHDFLEDRRMAWVQYAQPARDPKTTHPAVSHRHPRAYVGPPAFVVNQGHGTTDPNSFDGGTRQGLPREENATHGNHEIVANLINDEENNGVRCAS